MTTTTNATLSDFANAQQTTTKPTFGDNMGISEFRAACREYAEYAADHYDTFDVVDMDAVDVEVSTKLERAAGKAIKRGSEMIIRFAYAAYEKWGWERVTSTIRHELIHIVQFTKGRTGGHGFDFEIMADKVDCTKHCEKFTDYKYLLFCSECGKQVDGRHRKSKVVTNPEDTRYISPCCKATLESQEA